MNNRILEIKKLFSEGYTPSMVAKKVGLSPKGIHYYINKYNIEVLNKCRKYHVNDDYFDVIDTENKAYLLGFFIADGYLSEGRRICLNNSVDDINILELFQKEVSPTSKIIKSNKQNGAKFRKEQVTIRISSNHMYKTLVETYDIIENKTCNNNFKMNLELIPKEFVRDFIRGYFDGDGSVSFHKSKKTIFFNFSFVFNSINFTKQIGNLFEKLFNIRSVIYNYKGKTTNWNSLRFDYNRKRTEKIIEIYEYLYKDSKIFLQRKKTKFENYLKYRANSLDNTNEQCNA